MSDVQTMKANVYCCKARKKERSDWSVYREQLIAYNSGTVINTHASILVNLSKEEHYDVLCLSLLFGAVRVSSSTMLLPEWPPGSTVAPVSTQSQVL